MKNKGFTLIEIIGVLVILGILAVIATVTFTGSMKIFREDYYDATIGMLTESGKEFFNDNRKYRPTDILNGQIVPISTLISQKYVDDVVDYRGNKCNVSSYVIVVKTGKDDYTYHTCLKCDEDDYNNMNDKYCDRAWRNPENIEYSIANAPDLYVYKGTTRASLLQKLAVPVSYVKKNFDGFVIGIVDGTGFDDIPTVYPENIDDVDTNVEGVYPLDYVYNGKTTEGKVTVYSFEAPEVIIKKENMYAKDLTETAGLETGDYESGEWAQKIYVNLNPGGSTTDHVPNTVNRYQWNKDGVWQDFCFGTSCINKEVVTEMNEKIKFRSVSVEGYISEETEEIEIKIDNTKPACTLELVGNKNEDGWYTENVLIKFSRNEDILTTSTESVSGIKLSNITISTGPLNRTDNFLEFIHQDDTTGVKYIGYVEDYAQNFITCSITFKKAETIHE